MNQISETESDKPNYIRQVRVQVFHLKNGRNGLQTQPLDRDTDFCRWDECLRDYIDWQSRNSRESWVVDDKLPESLQSERIIHEYSTQAFGYEQHQILIRESVQSFGPLPRWIHRVWWRSLKTTLSAESCWYHNYAVTVLKLVAVPAIMAYQMVVNSYGGAIGVDFFLCQ